jgi:hypothetical protein
MDEAVAAAEEVCALPTVVGVGALLLEVGESSEQQPFEPSEFVQQYLPEGQYASWPVQQVAPWAMQLLSQSARPWAAQSEPTASVQM